MAHFPGLSKRQIAAVVLLPVLLDQFALVNPVEHGGPEIVVGHQRNTPANIMSTPINAHGKPTLT